MSNRGGRARQGRAGQSSCPSKRVALPLQPGKSIYVNRKSGRSRDCPTVRPLTCNCSVVDESRSSLAGLVARCVSFYQKSIYLSLEQVCASTTRHAGNARGFLSSPRKTCSIQKVRPMLEQATCASTTRVNLRQRGLLTITSYALLVGR